MVLATHLRWRVASLLCISASLLSGCLSGTPGAAPPTSPTATMQVSTPSAPTAETIGTSTPSTAAITTGIQQALDRYAQAYNSHNIELLKTAVDQSNPPFWRFMQTRFEGAQARGSGNAPRSYTVRTILKQRPFGFVLAQIASDGQVSDVTFREVGGRWVMAEPTAEQIGPRQQQTSAHFAFETYPWLDDINPKIIAAMEQARANVLQRLGKVPEARPTVHIKPIFGVGSITDPYVRAYYDPSDPAHDRIEIFAPQSYAFGFYAPATGWEALLVRVLTHEYTHLATNRAFTPIARMSDWMSEGLAEYVADMPHTAAVREAVRAGQIIPILDTSGRVNKQDLQHLLALNEDSEMTYGLAYALVSYTAERYGGLDGFWKLVQAYDRTQDLEKALQQAFGIDYTQFDTDWRAWLKQTYG
jgi:hypothetical protein